MYKKITTILALGAALASTASANETILVNADFSDGFTGWSGGSNTFVGGVWQAYVTDGYTLDDRVDPSGDGFVFTSWDDGESDRIETYLLQEFGAGPAGSATPNQIFETGDVIRFKGSASATTSDTDVTVRAFIKVLGYNELGWEFQIKDQYSAFQPLTNDLQAFDLSVTFPDLTVDDSLQVIQLGFEISTEFDGNVMDTGSIYFENLEGYIEGEEVMWAGYTLDANGNVDTGDWMGMVNATHAPWVYSYSLGAYVYVPNEGIDVAGAWVFTLAP